MPGESSAHSYSYHLAWKVVSSYLPLIHEVIYWENKKVGPILASSFSLYECLSGHWWNPSEHHCYWHKSNTSTRIHKAPSSLWRHKCELQSEWSSAQHLLPGLPFSKHSAIFKNKINIIISLKTTSHLIKNCRSILIWSQVLPVSLFSFMFPNVITLDLLYNNNCFMCQYLLGWSEVI